MDQSFRAGQDRGPSADTLGGIGAAAVAFLDALARREPCALPRAADALPPPAPPPAQQLAGASGKTPGQAPVLPAAALALLWGRESAHRKLLRRCINCRPCP